MTSECKSHSLGGKYDIDERFESPWPRSIITPGKAVPANQSATLSDIWSTLRDWVDELEDKRPSWLPDEQRQLLSDAVSVFQAGGNSSTKLHLLPVYGAALIGTNSAQSCWAGRSIHVDVIGLDSWEFTVHGNEFTAQPGAWKTVSVGALPDNVSWEGLLAAYKEIEAKCREAKGSKRSAAHGKGRGHQKTPAFVVSVARDALQKVSSGTTVETSPPKGGFTDVGLHTGTTVETSPPKGGFTDVGLHTGGTARDTVWPLVWTVLGELLTRSSDQQASSSIPSDIFLHRLCAYSAVWTARRLRPGVDSNQKVNVVLSLLRWGAAEALKLTTVHTELPPTECAAARQHQLNLIAEIESECAAIAQHMRLFDQEDAQRQFSLPYPLQMDQLLSHTQAPVLPSDCFLEVANTGSGGQITAQSCIESHRVLMGAPDARPWEEAFKTWARTLSEDRTTAAQYLLVRSVEDAMFKAAERVLPSPPDETKEDPVRLKEEDIRTLLDVVNLYRKANKILRTGSGKFISTSLCSMEVVVVWIFFCFVHQVTNDKYKVLQQFNVPLHGSDLGHLHLTNQRALVASLHVADYLAAHQGLQPVWSLHPSDCTQQLALQYASADPKIQEVWGMEQYERSRREKRYSAELREKRRRSEKLRNQISSLEKRLERLGKYRFEQEELDTAEAELRREQIPPTPVLHPLPEGRSSALQVLFFMRMPPLMKILCDASFEAQQALFLPIECSPLAAKSSKEWISWYDNHSILWAQSFPDRGVSFMFSIPPKPKHFPRRVDDIRNTEDGVWFPSGGVRLEWKGGAHRILGAPFNPFRTDSTKLTKGFTLRLSDKKLDWTMPTYPHATVTRTRGNEAASRLQDRPDWLNMQQWKVFANVRAYPHCQLRQLCLLLAQQDRLPLGQEQVHRMVRQLMYHVGELKACKFLIPPDVVWPSTSLGPFWKCDLLKGGILAALRKHLSALADQLKDNTQCRRELLLLVEINAFFADYDNPKDKKSLRFLRRTFAKVAQGWADERGKDIERAQERGDVRIVRALRAQRQWFLLCAILSYGGSAPLTTQDKHHLCVLRAQARNADPLLEVGDSCQPWEDEARVLAVRCTNLASWRSSFAYKPTRGALTAATRAVFEFAPKSLQWERTHFHSSVFLSKITDDASDVVHVYSINALTGVVHYDGAPPRRLPPGILDHPLYKEVFGPRSFEVVKDNNGFSTTRPIAGHFYYLSLCKQGDKSVLHVKELAAQGQDKALELELLDKEQWAANYESGGFPPSFPARYSAWICRKHDTLLLREHLFLERGVHFVGRKNAQTSRFEVLRVPDHRRSLVWHQLHNLEELSDMKWSRLLRSDGKITSKLHKCLEVLSKFEPVDGIHIYHTPADKRFRFELPRYNLSFDVKRNQLVSNDYRGFHLRRCQQLDNTLRSFRRYVVLVEQHKATGAAADRQSPVSVLVPCKAPVEPSRAPLASLQHFLFEQHPLFCHLQARSIAARLKLAALFAATSTLLPETSTGMTGGEYAVELLKQCWINRPLSAEEADFLRQVYRHSLYCSPLRVLCGELWASSQQLAFLYPHLEPVDNCTPMDADAVTAYRCLLSRAHLNLRLRLDENTERRVFGYGLPRTHAQLQCAVVDVKRVPVPLTYVSDLEAQLAALTRTSSSAVESKGTMDETKTQRFPLRFRGRSTVGHKLVGELKSSWNLHRKLQTQSSSDLPEHLDASVIAEHLKTVTQKEQLLRKYLFAALQQLPDALTEDEVLGAAIQRHRIARAVGWRADPVLTDLVRMAWTPSLVAKLNPFLSTKSRDTVRRGAVLWMELCVLAQRLQRCHELAAELPHRKAELVRELRVRRVWDTWAHPRWLAYELSEGIQIWPVQYAVARNLMDSRTVIEQLNMGQGKTRVIMPMLLLHWAQHSTHMEKRKNLKSHNETPQLVKLFILAPLLEEGFAFLHRHLCASVLNQRLFRLPFHRHVQLDPRNAATLAQELVHCQQVGGAIVQAPEHDLSLRLKRQELFFRCQQLSVAPHIAHDATQTLEEDKKEKENADKAVLSILGDVLARPTQCLFDESDAILHHRYQLIYAVGQSRELPDGDIRWRAVSTLLVLLQDSTDVRSFLQRYEHNVQVGYPTTHSRTKETAAAVELKSEEKEDADRHNGWPGQFYAVRILDVAATKTAKNHKKSAAKELSNKQFDRKLCDLLVDALFAPPSDTFCEDLLVEWRWLRTGTKPEQAAWRRYMTDKAMDYEDLPQLQDPLTAATRLAQLLAMRGLLAYGTLAHSLRRRYRVQYGLDERPGRKRIAVPYRACDKPTERSEFAHVDTALVLTVLSYYYRGLTPEQVKKAFRALEDLPPAHRGIYDAWFRRSAADSPASAEHELQRIDNIRKIDLTNQAIVDLLCKYFCGNMLTISFFLEQRVFLAETSQFSHSITASAWDLAHRSRSTERRCGFSGTNDTNLLLPVFVQPRQPYEVAAVDSNSSSSGCDSDVDSDVDSDDDKMLTVELQRLSATNGKMLQLLSTPSYEPVGDTWQEAVDKALDCGAHALIDAGALLSGASNRQVAEYVLQHLPGRQVDAQRAQACKSVVFFSNKTREWRLRDVLGREWALTHAPIREAEAFVVYDQARCRGADMRLKINAVALLTVGPGMCKDDLMQAAGRMRQLDRGQTVILAGPPEVTLRLQHIAQRKRKVTIGKGPRSKKLGARHVLSFVMRNTETSTLMALPLWARQGLHFLNSLACLDLALAPDKLELKDLYGAKHASVTVPECVGALVQEAKARRDEHNARKAKTTVKEDVKQAEQHERLYDQDTCRKILQRAKELAQNMAAEVEIAHEECERELELEEELEEEREVELQKFEPRAETDWHFKWSPMASVMASANASTLSSLSACFAVPCVETILWGDHVYVTSNFICSLASSPNDASGKASPLQYQRPVDMALVWPTPHSPTILLLSEREADCLLPRYWRASEQPDRTGPVLTHIACLRSALEEQPTAVELELRAGGDHALWFTPYKPAVLATTLLFDGGTAFPDLSERVALRRALRNVPLHKRQAIANARGLNIYFPGSDLQRLEDVDA